MKKRALKSIACTTVMALALSATACGEKNTAKIENSVAAEDAADTKQETEPTAEPKVNTTKADLEEPASDDIADGSADSLDSTEGYSTLEDYYNDPSVKSVWDAAYGVGSGDGDHMSLSIDARENTFYIIYKLVDSSLIENGTADMIIDGLEASILNETAKAFDDAIGQVGACVIVVRCTDSDDNVLAEKEFKAQ